MLEQEPIADKYFHALTPGKQRSLIYIVSQLKNPDPHIKKALGIVEHLKEEKGKLYFRLLQEKFKEINQRFPEHKAHFSESLLFNRLFQTNFAVMCCNYIKLLL